MSFFLYELLKRKNIEQKDSRFTDLQRKYASSETLCSLSYELDGLEANTISQKAFNLLNENGHLQEHKVIPITTCQDGLKPYVLIPLDKANKEVKVVFRGTTDLASLGRDLEVGSPGTVSFNQDKEIIFNQFMKITREHYQNNNDLHLTLAGHSLGASDAENFATYFCQRFAQENSLSPFKDLNVYSLNSPGITDESALQSILALSEIKKHDPNFMVNVYYGKTEHDPIQKLGQNHFLNNIDPALANITLIKLKKKFEFEHEESRCLSDLTENVVSLSKQLIHYINRSIHAHELKSYFTPDKNGTLSNNTEHFKILSNQSPEQCSELNSELRNKASSVLYIHQSLMNILNYIPLPSWRINKDSKDDICTQTSSMKLR